jgi:hypothetical protein
MSCLAYCIHEGSLPARIQMESYLNSNIHSDLHNLPPILQQCVIIYIGLTHMLSYTHTYNNQLIINFFVIPSRSLLNCFRKLNTYTQNIKFKYIGTDKKLLRLDRALNSDLRRDSIMRRDF